MLEYIKYSTLSAVILVLILAVSATITEKILPVPLYETGRSWMDSIFMLNFSFSTSFYLLCFLSGIVLFIYVIYRLYELLFIPMDRVRHLGDVGYIAEGRFTMKEMVNRVRKRRLIGDIPPVYPNGWFALIEGFKLKEGKALNISVLGLNLAVFRGEDGTSHAIDAYCPHMGANLAVGGHVIGDCLECPFHGWQFRGSDGKCTKIPYSEKVPDIARVKSYITVETNGWVYIWYHAEGSEPTWEIPSIDEINNGEWGYNGRTEHYINCHIEEVPENGADVQHLQCVHTPLMTSGVDLRYMWSKLWSFGSHAWKASWEPNPPPESHIGTMRLTHNLRLFGKSFSTIDMSVVARQIGPGIVYLTFDTMFGRGVYLHHLTPVEPMVQKLVHNIYFTRTMTRIVPKFLLLAEAIQVERDITIWNNKKYQSKPMFVKSNEDSLVAKHRRWYSQFYSENSPRLKFQNDTLDW